MRAGCCLLTMVLFMATPLAVGGSAMQPSIQELKRTHEARLLALPGVVSVGIGRDDEGREVIVVGLDKSRPETEANIRETLGDAPVMVRIIGTIKPLQH